MKHMQTIKQMTSNGALPARYTTITRNGSRAVEGEIIHERLVSIFVNGQELLTAMCSPIQQDALAIGFLANEGVIDSMDDVRDVHICPSGACVDVWLARADFDPPRRMILTSGCGGGVTFQDLTQTFPPLESGRQATPEKLWALMEDLDQAADLYSRARGVHTSALSDGQRLLLVAEDVGRHNTLDKLRGLALMQGIDTRDGILLSTGRVSSEMITKARHMGVPLVCSRTSPTSLSVALAEEWNITLVGYLRRNSMNVYTHPERVIDAEAVVSPNGRHTSHS
jgi:FdhD protein